MTVWRECEKKLKKLPDNLSVSARYCNRYSGFLVFDGKYVNVKGYPRGVSFLWGADFFTHDLPHFVFAPSESYLACLSYFTTLKRLSYPLKYLVCDDNQAIFQAARDVFPKVVIQLCLNHFLENIRRDLKIRSEPRYREFFAEVETIFKERLSLVEYSTCLREIYPKVRLERKVVNWIDTLIRRKEELLAYQQFPLAPSTTNLIEGYNSHLEGRLHSLKGFQSFTTARVWLNGYVLRRRLKKFTDCEGYFKPLNGTCSLQNTLKPHLKLPKIFS